MIQPNPYGDYPDIHKTAYVHPSAVIIGKVKIGKNVFVAPAAVIRADEQKSSIIIADNCNIQDKVIIHALESSKVIIGKNTSLAHGCIVHGPCSIGENCFIGFGSIVFKANLASSVFVKFLAVVLGVDIPERRLIPDGAIINTQEKVNSLALVSRDLEQFKQNVVKVNLKLAKGYLKKTTK